VPELNPRNLREKVKPLMGKKVMIGTADWHYVCGILEKIEGDQVTVTVLGKPVRISASNVATIKEAPSLQIEYIK
jgi:hypothetical protein